MDESENDFKLEMLNHGIVPLYLTNLENYYFPCVFRQYFCIPHPSLPNPTLGVMVVAQNPYDPSIVTAEVHIRYQPTQKKFITQCLAHFRRAKINIGTIRLLRPLDQNVNYTDKIHEFVRSCFGDHDIFVKVTIRYPKEPLIPEFEGIHHQNRRFLEMNNFQKVAEKQRKIIIRT